MDLFYPSLDFLNLSIIFISQNRAAARGWDEAARARGCGDPLVRAAQVRPWKFVQSFIMCSFRSPSGSWLARAASAPLAPSSPSTGLPVSFLFLLVLTDLDYFWDLLVWLIYISLVPADQDFLLSGFIIRIC